MSRSGTPTTPIVDDARVSRDGPAPAHAPELGSCWIWTGARQTQGYGMVSRGGRVAGAHRISWVEAHGDIPRGQSVLHRCDNPPCVRPSHLWLGTSRDNAIDRQTKGRGGRGDGRARREGRSRPMVTITLSPEALARLDVIAAERGQTRSATVEALVRNARVRAEHSE